MVDSINGAGGVPPVSNTNRASTRSDARASGDSSPSGPVDEVSISSEALDVAQAEQAALRVAADTRSILEARIEEALSGDNTAERLNALVVGGEE